MGLEPKQLELTGETEPAEEGVHWEKAPHASGRMRYFCLMPKCTAGRNGYSELSSLNRHLKQKHNKWATDPSNSAKSAVTEGCKDKAGSRTQKEIGTPPKEPVVPPTDDAATGSVLRRRREKEDAPPKEPVVPPTDEAAMGTVLRKRREKEDAAAKPQKKVTNKVKGQKGKQSIADGLEQETSVPKKLERSLLKARTLPDDSKLEEFVWNAKDVPELLDPQQYIDMLTRGLSAVSYKSKAKKGVCCQTFEAKWFQASADATIPKGNVDHNREGSLNAHMSNGHHSAGYNCSDNYGSHARFPVFGCTFRVADSVNSMECDSEDQGESDG